MGMAFDHSFLAAPSGISISHHKLGTLPHEKPPQYTDPNKTLDYFFKLLTRPEIQRQIWDTLKMPGATVWAITRAVIYQAALKGIIQLNLGIVIAPVVSKMIATIAKAGGVDAKMWPDVTSPQKEKYIKDGLKALMIKYDKKGLLTGKPIVDVPEPADASAGQGQPPAQGASGGGNSAGIAANAQPPAPNPTQQPIPASGIMGLAPQPNGGQ